MGETLLHQQGESSPTPPIITVAMPVFNAGKHLRLAVLSIVGQTFQDWELLIIDDGSTDNALQSIADIHDYRIRILQDGSNKGLAARLNEAIDLARGMYFARMDQDDISHPGRFAGQVACIRGDTTIDLVGVRCLTMSEAGDIVGTLPGSEIHGEICRRPWLGFYIPHPTWMGRIQWFRHHRYASPGPYFCEDQEMLLRTHVVSRFQVIPEFLLAYRLRDHINWKKLRRTRITWYRVQRRHFLQNREYLNAFLASFAVIGRLVIDVVKILRSRVPVFQSRQPSAKVPLPAEDMELWQSLIHPAGDRPHV